MHPHDLRITMPVTKKDPFHTHDLEIDTLVDSDAVVARVSFYAEGKYVYATGSSKRHPEDGPDSIVGEQIAVGRALIRLGLAMTRAGFERSHVVSS
jgi:hypothetical protein